ncbi:double-strand break repair helicase AddA [Sneathiella sp. P13V-1]|uniref:double-strand break repair helicase AddA n=1 Tax=Sneathiella sp. P13V-1 TaxID=2697366 RepID=UPI00187BA6D9|nr:double-strand break repair helicase AddA [Sneathiella sp. P13V-1]MBE7636008.1 double-strand break repair helicase AddA [Sneathiella sp. P13V-1]
MDNAAKLAERGNQLQRRAADPVRSVWVSASAGSGKTRVLVNRTLRLMLAGFAPERILCITFTKAAAAEMSNRLNEMLGKWSVMPEGELAADIADLEGRPATEAEMVRARRLFASVLDAPGGIKIQTIHSFCGSILGRFPLEAGIPPNFQELDDRTASEIMQIARDRMLSATQSGARSDLSKALSHVSQNLHEGDFVQLMSGLANRRGRLKRYLDYHDGLEGARDHIAVYVGIDPALREEDLISAACAEDAFDGAALRAALEVLLEGGVNDKKIAEVMEPWLSRPADRPALFDRYLSGFLTQKMEKKSERNLGSKKCEDKLPGLKEILSKEADRILEVLEKRRRIRVLKSSMAVLQLADSLIAEYEAEKVRRGALDFDDLILTTRQLLSGAHVAPWVMFKLDGGLDHILVDEAQDTSPEQWDVIGALAEEFFAIDGGRDAARTLFVVGDEKQSIYSFQGADPAAFDKMRQHFEAQARFADKPWEVVPLDLSFRSTHAVLSLVDATFVPPPARKGLTADASEIQHYIFREGHQGLTEIWPVTRPDEAEEGDAWDIPLDSMETVNPAATLARQIAEQVKSWLKSGEKLASTGRTIRAQDVLILVQKRNAFFEEMVRALKQAGVPVAGADRMQLSEQLAVLDLMALAKFALLPEDDLNLAIILKSPFVGMDDNELFDIAYRREGSLWQAVQEKADQNPKLVKALPFLRKVLRQADFIPVFEFFADILGPDRGREKLLSRLGEEAVDPIEEFLSLALAYQRSEASSLQGFLHWMEAGGAEVKRDMEQGRDEVRVLTVHGSKGLQAPIVFLPDTCQGSPHASKTSLIWTEEDIPGPLWAAGSANEDEATRKAKATEKNRQEEEKRRLLYVALTRAEDRLYICGWENVRKRPEGCWYDLIDHAFQEAEGVEEIELANGHIARRLTSGTTFKEVKEADTGRGEIFHAALPGWIKSPPPEEPFPPQPLTPSKEEEEPSVRSPLGSDDGHRFHRGLLVHRLLESLPEVPVARREEVAANWLARPAHGLSDAQQREILTETLKVLTHPDFSDIFGPGSRAEVPLTGLMGDRIMSGQIDRLLIRDDDILIVDYKTNRPSPRDLAEVPQVYIRQMQIYREALKKIHPEKAIKCGLLWTDGPYLMEIPQS